MKLSLANLYAPEFCAAAEALKASYASDFNDVAIVMFAREAGEGGDLSKSDKDGLPALRLHKQEADLSGSFC